MRSDNDYYRQTANANTQRLYRYQSGLSAILDGIKTGTVTTGTIRQVCETALQDDKPLLNLDAAVMVVQIATWRQTMSELQQLRRSRFHGVMIA